MVLTASQWLMIPYWYTHNHILIRPKVTNFFNDNSKKNCFWKLSRWVWTKIYCLDKNRDFGKSCITVTYPVLENLLRVSPVFSQGVSVTDKKPKLKNTLYKNGITEMKRHKSVSSLLLQSIIKMPFLTNYKPWIFLFSLPPNDLHFGKYSDEETNGIKGFLREMHKLIEEWGLNKKARKGTITEAW